VGDGGRGHLEGDQARQIATGEQSAPPVGGPESKISPSMIFRHTFASYLVMAGVDLLTVKELLSHKSFKMTPRYAHLSPSHKAQAISVLEEALGYEPTRQKLYNPTKKA
jgi:site-specific recombinase XerC